MKKDESGFTLVEVTVILMVLAVLSAILLVNLGGFNRMARTSRVKEDLGALCSAIAAYITDTGESTFWNHGNRDPDSPDRSWPVGLLVGDGDIPSLNRNVEGDGASIWQSTTADYFHIQTDFWAENIRFTVDTLANHLIHNTPQGESFQGYRTPADMYDGDSSSTIAGGLRFDPPSGQGFNALFAWRGPYLADAVEADPWGNRYMANVFALYHPQGEDSDGYASAVVCYSAGADEEIDSAFNQPGGWLTGDDDHVALVTAAAS